ncbi:MAG: efflux RND transporter periplasmic adaptor subunit [Acidobacteria bacterium]|nr:MAG: efflux RND transporter periplasmic adaptor subunit [Acidobacteriota bacterium]
MNDALLTPRRPSPLAVALGGLAAGFLAAAFVLLDPLDLHPLDERLRGDAPPAAAREHAAAAEHDHAEHQGYWTCGMHPEVIQEEPGQCPICHMDLVPLEVDPPAAGAADREPAGERKVLFYRNPMDPTITSPVPAKDEMGMDYVPVYADEVGATSGTTVRIDPLVEQNMNVRTARVERRDLRHPIRTLGYLDYDQERMVTVTTKFSGYIEKVYVNYVGEPVTKGQPLFEIYAPELVQTQQELLSALTFARRLAGAPEETRRRAEALVEAAETRLGYWDISREQIAELKRSGKVLRTLTVTAPASGLVMKRLPGLEGMAVKPGMEIFHIADLSSLWLTVEVFEDQIPWVREGTPAEVTLPYFPGKTFRSTVRFLEPELSEKTRTMRVLIEVPNRGGELRKGMYATVVFAPVAATDALVVPSEAVLRTGQRSVVVVALGGGRFAPREVVVGHEADGQTQILRGLEEGEEIVTSAQFLLDSESKLREAIQKMVARAQAPAPAGAPNDGAGGVH